MDNKMEISQLDPNRSDLQLCQVDFILSREAMLCTSQTMRFYRYNLGKFVEWLEIQGVEEVSQITARHVRRYLATYSERNCSDSYIHACARSIRTFLRFLYEEGYAPALIKFQMPRIEEKRLPVLSVNGVQEVIRSCICLRDEALILLLVDTGLRRSEVCSLTWGNVDFSTGLCQVKTGKGKKDRIVIIGARTKRSLLEYKRRVVYSDIGDPLFQTKAGKQLSPFGLRSIFVRLSEKSGIDISPHMLRRTFVVLSLKGGMSLAHVQALMGHTTPTMTLKYAQLLDDDLIAAHEAHGPVDKYFGN